jgi:hypothetical protein
MEDEKASHLLCKDRHAAFVLKKIQIPLKPSQGVFGKSKQVQKRA